MPAASIWTPGRPYIASASFTRPSDTTAYASGDLVANSTTAASVTPLSLIIAPHNGEAVEITSVRLLKSATSITNASFRIHFYGASPVSTAPTNGDNGAWVTIVADYFGYCDLTMSQTFLDDAIGIGVPAFGSAITAVPANQSSTIYALIEARAAYTPASAEVFTLYAAARQG